MKRGDVTKGDNVRLVHSDGSVTTGQFGYWVKVSGEDACTIKLTGGGSITGWPEQIEVVR